MTDPLLDAAPGALEVWGVCGGSGSGKSTLVALLCAALPPGAVAVLPFDAYYRDLGHFPPERRAATNFDHPDALDVDLLIEHLDRLRAGRPVQVPRYDFANHRRLRDTDRQEPAPLVLVEGILIFAFPALVQRFDYSVFLDVPEQVRLERRVARDLVVRGRTEESVRAQWAATVAPMYEAFVQPAAESADEVVSYGADYAELVARLAALARRRLRWPPV